MGYELPPNAVTSAQLEERMKPLYERLKLPYGRLEMMTGIRERRFWNSDARPSSVATCAAEKAIKNSGISKEELKVLFHASVCRDFLEPATANVVHDRLGLSGDAMLFDISNACLGVLNGIVMVANMIELGQVRAGIVVSGEMGESLVNTTIDALLNDASLTRQSIKPAFSSLTVGSAAVAIVVAHRDLAGNGHALLGGVVKNATEHNALCRSDADRGFSDNSTPLMDTDAEQLLNAGIELAVETWSDFKKELGWSNNVSRTFTHQVGAAHRKRLYEALGLDPAKDFSTVEYLGNTGSAALPVTLAIGAEEGVVSKGDQVALLGIGSGLNSVMLGLKW